MVYHKMMVRTRRRRHDPEHLDRIFSALGNRTRRSIVRRLSRGDATVSELAAPLDMTLPAVSKHLTVLERAGLISRAREHRSRRCSLRVARLGQARAWLAESEEFWTDTLDALAQHLEEDPAS